MIESAHMAAYRQYVIGPYAGRVTLFRAASQPDCHGDHPTLGWSEFAAAVDVTPIPGSHAGLVEAPQLIQALSRAVAGALAAPLPPGTGSDLATTDAARAAAAA
jgi:thioesterase domain-containing protein